MSKSEKRCWHFSSSVYNINVPAKTAEQTEKIESQKSQKIEKFLNKNIDKWTRTWYTNFCWCEISVKSTKIKIKKCLTREWRFDKIIFAAEKQIWSLKTEQWIWINTTHSQFKQTETNAKKTNFAGLEKPELARRTG